MSTASVSPRRRGIRRQPVGETTLVDREAAAMAGANGSGTARRRRARQLGRVMSVLLLPGSLLLTVDGHGADAAPRTPVARCAKHEHQTDRHPEKRTECGPLQTSGGAARGDFDADGRGDLAVGIPLEDVGSATDAGTVQVFNGSPDGPRPGRAQHIVEGTSAEPGDRFGAALAAGDFNGDGFSDLAVGRPGEDGAAGADMGGVSLFNGSANGLSTTPSGALVGSQAGGAFGAALVWGRFGEDPAADLAIGVPFADRRVATGTVADAGEVEVHFGSSTGLEQERLVLRQGFGALGETPEAGDAFGSTLAAGDLSVSEPTIGGLVLLDELLIGTPSEDLGIGADAGQVAVVRPTGSGFVEGAFLQQAQPEPGDRFGSALATANLDGTEGADLAVGVPFEDPRSLDVRDSGEVDVWFSAADGSGVGGAPNQVLSSVGGNQSGARFGSAVAANDFDGGVADLAVGAPLHDVGGLVDSGKVDVFYGGAGGLGGSGANPPQLLTGHQEGDRFGSALSGWGFNAVAPADLAVGIPFADVVDGTGVEVDAGRVEVYLTTLGFSFVNADVRILTQGGTFSESPEAGDQFGTALY
jgi:hypothetical protein